MRRNRVRSAVLALLVAASLVGLVVAFQSANTDNPTSALPKQMVRVFPESGTLTLGQAAIGYEVSTGFTGTLRIDTIEIPEDQIEFTDGINRVSFTPGQGTEVGKLVEGRHCASAVYWPTAEGRGSVFPAYQWCFIVS
ncbi:MAG: hypothetical protein ACR2H3_09975 [Acidimicrobiales bacterium]